MLPLGVGNDVPAGHLRQLVDPGIDSYWPTAQLVHLGDPSANMVPAGHTKAHAVAPSAAYMPTAQSAQVIVPAFPAAHVEQVAACTSAVTLIAAGQLAEYHRAARMTRAVPAAENTAFSCVSTWSWAPRPLLEYSTLSTLPIPGQGSPKAAVFAVMLMQVAFRVHEPLPAADQRPAAHVAQASWESCVPSGHLGPHKAAPIAAYWPAVQLSQSAAPAFAWELLGAQKVQLDAAPAAYRPAAQAVQTVVPLDW